MKYNMVLIFCCIIYLSISASTNTINIDSLSQNSSINCNSKILNNKLYKGLPIYLLIDIKNNYIDIDPPNLNAPNGTSKAEHKLMKRYFVKTMVFKSGYWYEYELINNRLPALSISVFDKRDKEIINKKPTIHSFYKRNYEWEDMQRIDGIKLNPQEKATVLVDLNLYLSNLDPGKYKIIIKLAKQINLTKNILIGEYNITLLPMKDKVKKTLIVSNLSTYLKLPGFISKKEEGQYALIAPKRCNKIISNNQINFKLLKDSLPSYEYSLIAPYLLFNKVYNSKKITDDLSSFINDFPSELSFFSEVLKYEINKLSKHDNKNNKIELLKTYPGTKWLLDKVDNNQGMIYKLMQNGSNKK